MQAMEKLPFKANVELFSNSLHNHITKLGPPVFQGSEFGYSNFGGWNLQSRTGDWRDGFQMGYELCQNKDGTYNYPLAKFLNLSLPFEHVNKTQACVGPYSKLVDQLTELGFYPRRMRLTVLKANSKSIIHRDAPADQYLARIHIPIITNEECIHWTEHGEFHMPADGSAYMLWVNNLHQIRNTSKIDRYHIICDAYDTNGITKNFKYNYNIKHFIKQAEEYRQQIEGTKLTLTKKVLYNIAKTVYMPYFKYKVQRNVNKQIQG